METVTKKPIKRDPNLVPLSREHHFGLLFGWKLKQGLANGSSHEIMRDYVLYFWKNCLHDHLKAEEDMLLGILPEEDEYQVRLQREHALIRELVQKIHRREGLSALHFEALHVLMTDHIRFEERIFFPHLETNANPIQLAKIGKHLVEEHAESGDHFLPEFWEKKVKK